MFSLKHLIIPIVLSFLFVITISEIHAYLILNIKLPTTKYGFVYPNRGDPNMKVTYVLEGTDVLISLVKVPNDFSACKLTTPDTELIYTLSTRTKDNEKVAFWSPTPNGCGARIKNVTTLDSGRWRLQAVTEDNYKIQSFINLQVIPNFNRPNGNFVIHDGQSEELNITFLANYCQVSNPHISTDYNVYDHCTVDLENINRLYSGKWKVSVGVYGKIDEIILEPSVTVLEEHFDVGYNKTGSKINLYCNLINAPNTTDISFCRFVKDGQDIGLRLNEGLSNGKYSYFGKSIKNGDCGVTIEKPERNDYVTWKCTLGLYRNIDNATLKKYEVKESIISLPKSSKRSRRSVDENLIKKAPEVLTAVGETLTLTYKTDFIMKYCIIKHPNGTLFTINEKPIKNKAWESKNNLNIGVCGMKFFNASENESGIWHFHLGHEDIQQMDDVVSVNVRVGETALVAVKQNVVTTEGSQLTLKCKAVATPNVLDYCRFSLPGDNVGFRIDEQITKENSIQNLYWYNNKTYSLNKGDCVVTIKTVSSKHFGKWTCAGYILGSDKNEDIDYFFVSQESAGLTIASISGIVGGSALGIILIAGAFIFYQKKKRQQPQRRQTYLSSTSHSSAEVTHFQRTDPMVSIEDERQSSEIIEQPSEDIEMAEIEEARRPTPSTRGETITSM